MWSILWISWVNWGTAQDLFDHEMYDPYMDAIRSVWTDLVSIYGDTTCFSFVI